MTDGLTESENDPRWELNNASKNLASAISISDPAAIRAAIHDLDAALTNQSMVSVIPMLKQTLEVVLKSQLGELTTRLDNSDNARLNRNSQFQNHIDDRFDAYGENLTDISIALGGLQLGVNRLQGDFREIGELVNNLQLDVKDSQQDIKTLRDTLHTDIAAVKADIAEIRRDNAEYRKGSKRADVEILQAQMLELRGNYTKEEREKYARIFLAILKEYEALHPDA